MKTPDTQNSTTDLQLPEGMALMESPDHFYHYFNRLAATQIADYVQGFIDREEEFRNPRNWWERMQLKSLNHTEIQTRYGQGSAATIMASVAAKVVDERFVHHLGRGERFERFKPLHFHCHATTHLAENGELKEATLRGASVLGVMEIMANQNEYEGLPTYTEYIGKMKEKLGIERAKDITPESLNTLTEEDAKFFAAGYQGLAWREPRSIAHDEYFWWEKCVPINLVQIVASDQDRVVRKEDLPNHPQVITTPGTRLTPEQFRQIEKALGQPMGYLC